MAEQDMKHFEDLPAKDILDFLSRPADFSCTEKLDGSNIVVGRDEKGIYTRRDKKEKYYRVEDYETSFFTNFQKLALAALLEHSTYVEQLIEMDEEVGAEVLIGFQPNVVCYVHNTDVVTIVLFKKAPLYFLKSISGKTENVKCKTVNLKSYTESEVSKKQHSFRIRTIDHHTHELNTRYLSSLQIFLCATQHVSGVDLTVHDIIDWPLNRQHPAKFDLPWKDVKPIFKSLRSRYRDILRQKKSTLFPVNMFTDSFSMLNEGFVITDGNIEFKLVDQHAFLLVKNFIWKFRDTIKNIRKEAGEISTLEQVAELKSKYLDTIDKYQAEEKNCITVIGITGHEYTERRTACVRTRDRSAFVTAFDELSRIESEIRRN